MDDDNAKKKISRKEMGTIIGILWQKHKDMGKSMLSEQYTDILSGFRREDIRTENRVLMVTTAKLRTSKNCHIPAGQIL